MAHRHSDLRWRAPTVIAIVAAALSILAAPAPGASLCAPALIEDWTKDGQLQRTYALRCYPAAIAALPVDLRQYSNAEDDIRSALSVARRARTERIRALSAKTARNARAAERPESPSTPTVQQGRAVEQGRAPESKPRERSVRSAAPRAVADADAAASAAKTSGLIVPLPVLVLGALSGLLLMLGGSGYVLRRVSTRRPPT